MRKWAREKLAWQGRKKVIGAGWQIFAEKEMGGLGVKDPGLVCEEAGINTFLRSALEKEGTVCSRIVEQRIKDNKRFKKMGCVAGALEKSVLNEASRVNGAQTISNAELEAVEIAVKK